MRLDLPAVACALVAIVAASAWSPNAAPDAAPASASGGAAEPLGIVAPATAAAHASFNCDLTRSGDVCWFSCRPQDHVSVFAPRGSSIRASCGSAYASCEGACNATSELPALDHDLGTCFLDAGREGRCVVWSPVPDFWEPPEPPIGRVADRTLQDAPRIH